MPYLQYIVICAFIIINARIIWDDIIKRKIPNQLLYILLGLLPLWYVVYPLEGVREISIYLVMSALLIVGGVGLYREDGFLGSGDIKYASIIILYLVPHSLPLYIGNVGAITILILIFWIAYISGQILAMRRLISRTDMIKILPERSGKSLVAGIGGFMFDWVVIGFFLYMALRNLSVWIFSHVALDRDFYFLLTLIIFLLRPGLRYMLTRWEHRIYAIIGMILYYGIIIRDLGFDGTWLEEKTYLAGVWKYALAFTILQIIATTVFRLYHGAIEKLTLQRTFHTIPYSVVIFAGFATLVWGHWDLMTMLKNSL